MFAFGTYLGKVNKELYNKTWNEEGDDIFFYL